MMGHPVCNTTPEQLAWDTAGVVVGQRDHGGYSITIRKRPDGLFLAKFLMGLQQSPMRFLGDTKDLAEQFAVDYIDAQLKPREPEQGPRIFLPGGMNE